MNQNYACEKLDGDNTPFQFAVLYGNMPSKLYMKAAGKEVSCHMHEHCQLVKCYEGRVSYWIRGEEVKLENGEILVINPGVPHSWIAMEPSTCLRLGFYPETLEFNSYSRPYIPYIRQIYGERYPYIRVKAVDVCYLNASNAIDRIRDAAGKKGLFYDAYIHNQIVECSVALIENMLGEEYYHHPSAENRLLERIMQYIDDHIMQEISMDGIAGEIGFNSSYFSDYFKRKTGITFKKYINNRRIELAAGYLRNTQLPVTDIVFLCGFGSMSAFYHNFSQQYGISPVCFRDNRNKGKCAK